MHPRHAIILAAALTSVWLPVCLAQSPVLSRSINIAAPGIIINRGILGMDCQPKAVSAKLISDTLAAGVGTSMRFGGDGYNWKTRRAEWNAAPVTVLQRLRDARDRGSYLQICLNTRGIGTGNGSTWAYTDQTPETLAALAADWVYYCNKLLPAKRQGDALTTREQALLDSLDWGTEDKLLAPNEPVPPPVIWWEIGNEPEGPYPPPALAPQDYANRYRIITAAMLAEDPAIKVGPGCMSADNGNAWLDAVFSNTANRVDHVAYHPYGPLYWIAKNISGNVLNAQDLSSGLNWIKTQQRDRRQKMLDRLAANNRPAGTPLLASEWNPSSWEGTYYLGLAQSVAHGLGVAETIFTFAELGFTTAQYWEFPNYPSSSARENPGFKVLKALQAHMGEKLIDSFSDGPLRLYTTLDGESRRLVLWAVNLSDETDHTVNIRITGPAEPTTVTERKLSALAGDTSLVLRNAPSDPSDQVDWTITDRTGQLDFNGFTATFEDATLTLLIFGFEDLAPADLDRDGDVDMDDFGRLQACFSGSGETPIPECEVCRLDADTDVDGSDLAKFRACFTGAGVLAKPDCVK